MSVEFSEYRPFASGDDWRAIDWNAYARWRQLILKLFTEEEDLHVHLLLDCSRSMDWGEPSKFDQARRILGGLACMALASSDRVGFVPLDHPLGGGFPPHRGRGCLPAILKALTASTPTTAQRSLEESVRDWLRALPRRGLVLFASDCFGSGGGDALRSLDCLRKAGHDVGVVQVVTEDEISPPRPGEYVFEDCETGRIRRVVLDRTSAARFQSRVGTFLDNLEAATRTHGLSFLRVSNTDPLPKVLISILSWT